MEHVSKNQVWLQRLDRVFWLVWVALPIIMWLNGAEIVSSPELLAAVSSEMANCLRVVPNITNFSTLGKVLFWGLFSFEVSIYVITFAALHTIVHAFASDRIFVQSTLHQVGQIAILLLVWPFFSYVVHQSVVYALYLNRDLPVWRLSPEFDVEFLAVGIFLIALKLVFAYAIELKTDHELTI